MEQEHTTPKGYPRGTIPPPEAIREYESVIEGAGKRILEDAHAYQELDRFLTKSSYNRAHAMDIWSTVASALIITTCFTGIFLSIFLIHDTTKAVTAITIFGIGIAIMIGIGFSSDRRRLQKSEDREANFNDRSNDRANGAG